MTPTVPKERPILFKGEMVNAILRGDKTQTRRAMKPQPMSDCVTVGGWSHSPYGQPGDRLWVKETFAYGLGPIGKNFDYRADCDLPPVGGQKWKPSIFMPRRASRITLEITAVKVERLNDISNDDAIAEGCHTGRCVECGPEDWPPLELANHHYMHLWESINGKNSWAVNPWVWAITFKRLTPT